MLTIAELASESYVAPRTKDELIRDYKRLAKSADARLRRLEKAQYRKGFEAITKYAYERAMKDIGRGEGGRFDISMNNMSNSIYIRCECSDNNSLLFHGWTPF